MLFRSEQLPSRLGTLFAGISEVIATSFLAKSNGFTNLAPTATALVGYTISFFLLSLTLRTVPTGVAYAIWSGVGIVLVSAVAYFWQGQKLDAPALIGMAIIMFAPREA